MTKPDETPALDQLDATRKKLALARTVYDESKIAYDKASRELNEAVNKLRDNEKEFDKIVERIRAETVGGDWESSRRQKSSVSG